MSESAAIGPRSQAAFAEARAVLPGGVSSPVRAYKAVGGGPPVIARGEDRTSSTSTAGAISTTSAPTGR